MLVNEAQLDRFMEVYEQKLRQSLVDNPENYRYKEDFVPTIVIRTRSAVRDNFFGKETPTYKRTCAALGIPHTYKAIGAFIERRENRRQIL